MRTIVAASSIATPDRRCVPFTPGTPRSSS